LDPDTIRQRQIRSSWKSPNGDIAKAKIVFAPRRSSSTPTRNSGVKGKNSRAPKQHDQNDRPLLCKTHPHFPTPPHFFRIAIDRTQQNRPNLGTKRYHSFSLTVRLGAIYRRRLAASGGQEATRLEFIATLQDGSVTYGNMTFAV
jgi:hypothetical protein